VIHDTYCSGKYHYLTQLNTAAAASPGIKRSLKRRRKDTQYPAVHCRVMRPFKCLHLQYPAAGMQSNEILPNVYIRDPPDCLRLNLAKRVLREQSNQQIFSAKRCGSKGKADDNPPPNTRLVLQQVRSCPRKQGRNTSTQ